MATQGFTLTPSPHPSNQEGLTNLEEDAMSKTTRSSYHFRVSITLASDNDISYNSDESSTEALLDHRTVASDIPGTQSIKDHHKKATVPKVAYRPSYHQ
jgi:hypothetical protein